MYAEHTLYLTYMMARNHSTYYINSKFSKNKKRTGSLVTKFIFLKTKTKITCNSQYYVYNVNPKI